MHICPPKGQCLLTTSCQTQDSGFTDVSVKSTASDVCEDVYSDTVDEAEENIRSVKDRVTYSSPFTVSRY